MSTDSGAGCLVDERVLSVGDVRRLIRGRHIYVWGAALKGRGIKMALERNRFEVAGFLDKHPLLVGSRFQGVEVAHPDAVLHAEGACSKIFVVLASGGANKRQMVAACRDAGMEHGRDFLEIADLSPYFPTVEVCGTCNFRCIACPRGRSDIAPYKGGFMAVATYERIVEKLVAEIPFIYDIDLYLWGEPLLHPELAHIISINKANGIASGISTNLSASENLEKVIEANPEILRVALSGVGSCYESTHRGGKWETFHKNLYLLRSLIDRHGCDTTVELYFHANRQNLQQYPEIKRLAEELGFRNYNVPSMVFPELVLDSLKSGEFTAEAKLSRDLMLIPLDEMLAYAQSKRGGSCLQRRAVPVINWNSEVLVCCHYFYRALAPSFLDTSLKDIIRLRHQSDFCAECRSRALHRYFDITHYQRQVEEQLRRA